MAASDSPVDRSVPFGVVVLGIVSGSPFGIDQHP
jgi:hypothetical protein